MRFTTPEPLLALGFDRRGKHYILKPEFRAKVELVCQDIREELPPGPFHLILCRYLPFTYFDASLQDKTLRCLVGMMRTGGALVIGKGETLPPGEFGLIPWSEEEGVYRRA